MRGIGGIDPGWGITVVRIAMGLVFAVHGYQKFAEGLAGVSAFFAKMSIPLPGVMAPFIAALELVGGLLLLLGLGTRWLGLLYAIEMFVVTFWVKIPRQGWQSAELESMLLAGAIMLSLAGPGKLAIDER
jgi:putative oxidoreductase